MANANKSKSFKLRKRDAVLFVVVIAVVLLAVVGVAGAVEHASGKNRSKFSDITTAPTEPAAQESGFPEPIGGLADNVDVPADDNAETGAPDSLADGYAPRNDEDAPDGEEEYEAAETQLLSMPEDTGLIPGARTVDEVDLETENRKVTEGLAYNNNIKNIVLIGVDRQQLGESDYYRDGGQSDVILVVSMNLKTKQYFILSINRDLAVPIENYATDGSSYGVVDEQIALAYAYGDGARPSGNNVLKSLNWLLGDDIKFLGYIAAPIPIVSTLADAVDGVEVLVEDDFSGVDDTLIEGERVVLRGIHAENFVRARMTMKVSNKNVLRMNRQIVFMKAFMEKAKSTMTANQMVDLYDDIMDMTVTNMGKSDITNWILTAYDYEFTGFYRIDGVEGERKNNARCTYEDPEKVQELVESLYYQQKN